MTNIENGEPVGLPQVRARGLRFRTLEEFQASQHQQPEQQQFTKEQPLSEPHNDSPQTTETQVEQGENNE